MAGNPAPIYSKVGDIQGGNAIVTASADWIGQNINNQMIFIADATNGGFVQRLRFKANGTNVATVARVYINNGSLMYASPVSGPGGTPTGTPSGSGGTLLSCSLFGKIQCVDQWGGLSNVSTESASVSVTGPTGSVAWAWTNVANAASYRIYVGAATGAQSLYFTSTTNTYTQTSSVTGSTLSGTAVPITNNYFYGEISLPATTLSATAATVEIDYPMNVALPPGYRIHVGLGTTVAGGWICTALAGKY